jgi:outer membrane protein assembly factor BamB
MLAEAALISGTIQSVNSSGRIVVKTSGGKTQSFEVAAGAKITLDGKTAKLEDLTAGQRISVFTSDAGKVTEVKARAEAAATPKPEPKPRAPEPTATATGSAGPALAGWTQYGGPNRDNLSPETGLLASWPEGGPQLKWTATNLGEGYSAVSLAEGKVYTMGLRNGKEETICLDLENGKEIWGTPTGTAFSNDQGNGPRGTPTLDGDFAYVLGGNGDLACLDRNNGQIKWSGNILREFDARNIVWGISESVLIDGEKAVVTPGGNGAAMVALNKNTGKLLWKAAVPGNPQTGYSSPIIVTAGGVKQYVNFLHTAVVGIDANTGKTLWGSTSAANGTANCSSPVASGNFVFAASGYGTGGTLIELAPGGGGVQSRDVYHTNNMKSHHGGMVLLDGHIYGTDEGIMTCLDLRTGDMKWQDRSVGKGAIVYADGHLILRSEQGPVAMFAATSEGYQEQGRFNPPKSNRPSWAHPVVAEGCLFLRDQDKLYCYAVK